MSRGDGVGCSKSTNHLTTTKCKIDCGNQKPRVAVRDDALTGRSRAVKDVDLSALLYVLEPGEWLVLWLLG